MTRKGRGRLSGIELLPAEASPVIAWAANELRSRDRTQTVQPPCNQARDPVAAA